MELERDSISKLTATQNIIRNKCKKTYSDRLLNEHNVIRAMKPLTISHAFKTISLETIKINDLCTRLGKLIKSTVKRSDSCNEEIQFIINKLREHEIIV